MSAVRGLWNCAAALLVEQIPLMVAGVPTPSACPCHRELVAIIALACACVFGLAPHSR